MIGEGEEEPKLTSLVSAKREKRLDVIGFFILAGSFVERKMFGDRLRKAQGPEGFHDHGKTTKGSHQDVGGVFNQLERKDPLRYIQIAPPG